MVPEDDGRESFFSNAPAEERDDEDEEDAESACAAEPGVDVEVPAGRLPMNIMNSATVLLKCARLDFLQSK